VITHVSTFRDRFILPGTRPRGWEVGFPYCPNVAQADGFRVPHLWGASTVSLYMNIDVLLRFSGVSVNTAGTACS
jgi:hypothetical protein